MNQNLLYRCKTTSFKAAQAASIVTLTLYKRWVIAQKRNIHSKQHHDNIAVEAHYHVVLANAKRLFIGNTQPFFERNLKGDIQYAEAMHAYMTSSFYLYLECEYTHNYQVHFTFCKCPFEKELRDALKPLIFEKRANEVRQEPDYPTFYKAVLAFQDKKHIHSL